jgi:hypothetical protein
MPFLGPGLLALGSGTAAAVWRACRTTILAGWAALGCDVRATGGPKSSRQKNGRDIVNPAHSLRIRLTSEGLRSGTQPREKLKSCQTQSAVFRPRLSC